ncbi:MAG: serine hydrolase [Burkholderiales bacterium]|nr:serine hydrolase [Flavobacterium sp.]
MKKVIKYSTLALVVGISYLAITNYPKLDLISGFSAKNVASGHFIAQRSIKMIEKGDNDIHLIDLATNKIDNRNQFATAAVFGLKERKAIYREGLGVTLIDADFDLTKPYELPKRVKTQNHLPFPYGDSDPEDALLPDVDYKKLKKAVADAFDLAGEKKKRTRSVIVVYKDQIIAEQYETGFDKNSKILGWSMTKSITSALFGVLQKQRKLDIYKPAPVAQWQNDARAKITINDLLHMNSGLEWEENYEKICDATQMLFQARDMPQCQRRKPAKFAPNSHWYYSSGTTNLLSGILRNQFQTHQQYLDFWYSALIDKIGMHSMVVETDMAGNFVGSSYGWATTRDWAKFGLLYLHKGNWNGAQILDESWVDYSATPTNTSHGNYGAHFWLNAGGKFPNVPRDFYYCSGFQGQMIAIIPSLNLVIVRLGLKEDPDFGFNAFLSNVIASLKK